MDDFERRLAASMKVAALQRPEVERASNKRLASLMALAAAVVIGGVIAGTTFLFDPSGSPSTSAPVGDVTDLEGEWTLTALNDADGKPLIDIEPGCVDCIPPLAERLAERGYSGPEQTVGSVSVQFDQSVVTIGSQGKCRFSAKYSQSGERGSDLRFSSDNGFAVNEDAGCPSEMAFYSRLADVRQVTESDGVLSLLAEAGSTIGTLERVFTVPINLEGKWTFADLTDTGRFNVGPNFRPYSLTFADGRVIEKSGCVTITATYEQRGTSAFVFSDIQRLGDQGRSNCASPPERERLSVVRQVTYTDGILQLRDENGTIITELRRQSARACIRCPFGFDTGNIMGRVVFAGGLSSTSPRTLSQGLVKFVRPAAAGRSGVKAQTSIGPDGIFSVALPPGTYSVTATSPEFTLNGVEGVCRADKTVTVTRYATSSVTVYCNNK